MSDQNNDIFLYHRITNSKILVQRIRSEIYRIIFDFFASNAFTYIDPPILHEQIHGKKHEIYLPLYNDRYSLSSSNALYLTAYSAHLGNVYSISPTFRNEQNSVNHLVEFRMLEVEIQNMSYPELTDYVETLIKYILNALVETKVVQSSQQLFERVNDLISEFHPQRIRYQDFIRDNMQGKNCTHSEHQTDPSNIDYVISQELKQPVFLTEYPRKYASWTAKPHNLECSCAINLMLSESYGELCEGCERTNDTELLRYKMNCAGVTNLEWYLQAVSQIHVSRCGFGIGLDRLVRWIAGLPSITDTLFFPRTQ